MSAPQTVQASWVPFRQAQVVLGSVRYPDKPKKLPRQTLTRWAGELKECGVCYSKEWKAFDPDSVQTLYRFAVWLAGGGTVEGFKALNKKQEKQSNDTARRQEQESVQQDDSLNWFSS